MSAPKSRPCAQCGNTFTTGTPFTTGNAKSRFCSAKCRYRHKDSKASNRRRQNDKARQRYQTDELHRARKLKAQREAYKARKTDTQAPDAGETT